MSTPSHLETASDRGYENCVKIVLNAGAYADVDAL
jgi:hypothetical protein